ncbi:uncharacterized protein ARMOST_02693 [Armillaria ostoyae]|uniref:Uncharacterized protein n=1 Tax=Armillaria ostoyae TaxID=47428 RepID=A0A284QSF1_ARMOS|nr:uncharacterized protein ARMOST_02693 [Armillaria ostoyae]
MDMGCIRTGDIESKWVYAKSRHISPLPDILWFVDAVRDLVRDLDCRCVEYLMHEKEFGYALNRKDSTRTNDILALGVVLVTMVTRRTFLATFIPSSQKTAPKTNP